MKALTICQPWAHLIVTGEKRVENREWSTKYRGPLLIHAGKSRAWLDDGPEVDEAEMAFGAVVGIANLAACLHIDTIKSGGYSRVNWPWLATHEHARGTWCWILTEVMRYEKPVPYRGKQGLFFIPDNLRIW